MFNNADVLVSDHGSVCMVTPLTGEARDWVDENVGLESWQWLGGGFAVDPRYLADLIDGMEADGLVIDEG